MLHTITSRITEHLDAVLPATLSVCYGSMVVYMVATAAGLLT